MNIVVILNKIMNLKQIFYWFSLLLGTFVVLFVGLNIPLVFLDGAFGLDFYHFIILGVILSPFILKFLYIKSKEREFPNGFLWFVLISFIIFPFLIFFLWDFFDIVINGFGGWSGIFIFAFSPIILILGIINYIIYIKSKKLS